MHLYQQSFDNTQLAHTNDDGEPEPSSSDKHQLNQHHQNLQLNKEILTHNLVVSAIKVIVVKIIKVVVDKDVVVEDMVIKDMVIMEVVIMVMVMGVVIVAAVMLMVFVVMVVVVLLQINSLLQCNGRLNRLMSTLIKTKPSLKEHLKLFQDLEQISTYACGTIRSDRGRLPADFKGNLQQGESRFLRVTNSMAVHRKDVYALSTIHGTEESKTSRRDGNDINKPLKSSGNTASI